MPHGRAPPQVYTVLSALLFPRTATEEMVHKLGLALHELRNLVGGWHHACRRAAVRLRPRAGRGSRTCPSAHCASANACAAAAPATTRRTS